MEFGTVALKVVSTLVGRITKKISEKFTEKAEEIYQEIKEKLSNDSYATQTLKRLVERPDSEERQKALEIVITERMKEDPVFAEKMQNLVNEVKEISGSENVVASGKKIVAIGGNVSDSPIIIGNRNKIDSKGSEN
jgi:NAD(P)H-dependent flavin oxidoreductase YrpB (nitropropane dioxygenase family)